MLLWNSLCLGNLCSAAGRDGSVQEERKWLAGAGQWGETAKTQKGREWGKSVKNLHWRTIIVGQVSWPAKILWRTWSFHCFSSVCCRLFGSTETLVSKLIRVDGIKSQLLWFLLPARTAHVWGRRFEFPCACWARCLEKLLTCTTLRVAALMKKHVQMAAYQRVCSSISLECSQCWTALHLSYWSSFILVYASCYYFCPQLWLCNTLQTYTH